MTLPTPTLLPILGLTEPQMIDDAATWVERVRHTMAKEYSHEQLETMLRQGLRDGALVLTIKAVEAADAGDEIADAALRHVGAELQMPLVQRRDLAPGHLQVIAYLQRAARRAPHTRPRGHRWYDDWIRNLHICFLVAIACREFSLSATRNRETRRANREPSGISVVAAALARNGIHIEEKTVQNHIWHGLPGELVRQVIAERPLESWLAVAYPK
jgi:hypothetical protein